MLILDDWGRHPQRCSLKHHRSARPVELQYDVRALGLNGRVEKWGEERHDVCHILDHLPIELVEAIADAELIALIHSVRQAAGAQQRLPALLGLLHLWRCYPLPRSSRNGRRRPK